MPVLLQITPCLVQLLPQLKFENDGLLCVLLAPARLVVAAVPCNRETPLSNFCAKRPSFPQCGCCIKQKALKENYHHVKSFETIHITLGRTK
jgi:hypothetical protein